MRLRCTVFAPQTDCVLPGRVNAIAPNYVGLLSARLLQRVHRRLRFTTVAFRFRWSVLAEQSAKGRGRDAGPFQTDEDAQRRGILSFEGCSWRSSRGESSPGDITFNRGDGVLAVVASPPVAGDGVWGDLLPSASPHAAAVWLGSRRSPKRRRSGRGNSIGVVPLVALDVTRVLDGHPRRRPSTG